MCSHEICWVLKFFSKRISSSALHYKLETMKPGTTEKRFTYNTSFKKATEFNVRINAQPTPKPFPDSEIFYELLNFWDHFQICANTAIHRSIFLPILIQERIYSLSSYICLIFRSSLPINVVPLVWDIFSYVYVCTRALLVSSVSSQAHIQTPT